MQQGLLVKFSCNSPTLYLIPLLRALLVVRSFVLEWQVVATTCYRSWLVAKGFSQIKEIKFDELFSLVVYYETACLFLAVAVLEDWNIHSINIKTIYFYSYLDKKIYMEQSEGFRLSSNFTKHYTALSKLAYLGGRL